MAITIDDFAKVWASNSPLTPYEFSENNYKEGWNFIGGTPPSRQMWDFLQKQNDEKSQYLLNNFDNYLPLSGGTMTGTIKVSGYLASNTNNTSNVRIVGGTSFSNGSALDLYGKDHSTSAGRFVLVANDGTNSKHFVGKPDGTLTWDGQPLLPVGIVQAFAGTTIPNGWLLCDGSAVSRTDYADLYAVIGDTYGAGDGSTTFNVPNLVDKFVEGSATSGTVKSAGLPNITGNASFGGSIGLLYGNSSDSASGAFYPNLQKAGGTLSTTSGSSYSVGLDASRSSSVYGNSTTVQPPALTMQYIIKY